MNPRQNGVPVTGLMWRSPYISKTTILQVHHTFFYISLPTTTWMCLIPRFVEDGNRKQQLSFSFPELWYSPLELDSTPKKFANIWRIKRGRIRVIKFKAASIHFWSHVFVTVRLWNRTNRTSKPRRGIRNLIGCRRTRSTFRHPLGCLSQQNNNPNRCCDPFIFLVLCKIVMQYRLHWEVKINFSSQAKCNKEVLKRPKLFLEITLAKFSFTLQSLLLRNY